MNQPFGIYYHYPTCRSKCPYCDFYSTVGTPDPRWAELAQRQCEIDARSLTATRLASIYFGGGTPSLAEPEDIGRLIAWNRSRFPGEEPEITLEVNPGTVDLNKLKKFRLAGVNRLSVGVQSFNDAILSFLGRIHDAQIASTCLDQARKAGFDNIGLDLILATDPSTLSTLKDDLEAVGQIKPDHISLYFLTIEGDTPFTHRQTRGESLTSTDEEAREQYVFAVGRLEEMGFGRYEISNFSKPGKQSVHNRLYWQGDEYLGIGPSATGFVYVDRYDQGRRSKVVLDSMQWAQALDDNRDYFADSEDLTARELAFERVFLELRTKDGLDLERLKRRYGIDLLTEKADELTECRELGWVIHHEAEKRLHLTEEGILFSDSVFVKLA